MTQLNDEKQIRTVEARHKFPLGGLLDGLLQRRFGEARVEAPQGGPEIAGEDDFALIGAA
jgi:hypothetical protein